MTAALSLVAVSPSSAQGPRGPEHAEAGRPIIRSFSPEEYGGGAQNWAIIQDHRGLLYVGGTNGVLEYDGVTWRLILTPNQGTVRSLAIDGDGRIWAGAVNDLGHLEPNGAGELRFVSLTDRIPENERGFGDVWRTHVLADGVYFQTETALYRWAGGQMRVLKPSVRFNRSSAVDGRLYVPQTGVGMTVLEGDTFRPLPGTEPLADEVSSVVLPFEEGRVLFGTRVDGLFLYDGKTLAPFPTEVDPLIKGGELYRGFAAPDGTFGLATSSAGIALVDRQGRRVQVIDKEVGLTSNIVNYAMVDRDGALWVALTGGLSRVETPSPASFFGEDDGLPSGVLNLIRHGGRLYVAHRLGVSSLQPGSEGRLAELLPVAGIRNQVWGFLNAEDPTGVQPPQLLVAASDGLFRIEGDRAHPLETSEPGLVRAAVLLQSRVVPDRVWVGLYDGLASLRWRGGRWAKEGRLTDVTDQIRSLHETADGSLWAGTQATGVLRIGFAATSRSDAPPWGEVTVERFGPEHGLAPGGVHVYTVAGSAYFLVGGGDPFVATFDDGSQGFVRAPAFDAVGFNLRTSRFGLREGPDGRVFVNFGREIAVAEREADGAWTIDRAKFSRFGDQPSYVLYPEPDGVTWFAAGDRLIRFDTSQVTRGSTPLTTLIRSVIADQTRLIFGGADVPGPPPILDSSVASLRFEFATPAFQQNMALEYQSRLDGYEREWTPWTSEARRDFTNLGHGDYRLHVRARDSLRRVSHEASFAFAILPPWHRTWWAYGMYGVLLAAGALAVDRFQRRRVVRRERQRAQFAEARVRAEAAEALARSEGQRNRSIELLSAIGREITASLDTDAIVFTLRQRMSELVEADRFSVGLCHPDSRQLEYRASVAGDERLAPHLLETCEPDQVAAWCIEHRQPILVNDPTTASAGQVDGRDRLTRPLEDSGPSRPPRSLICLPLVSKQRVLGVVTVESFSGHAYTEHHLNLVQTLASYAAIALDNAEAYRQLNEQEHEIRRLFEEARRAQAAAEEADASKSAFLSTVSHELRTPLTAVLGFAVIIRKRLNDRIFPIVRSDDRRVLQAMQQVEDNLRVVVSEGERLTHLIDDVLDLAKIEAGRVEWHMDRVSVVEVIDRATDATSSLLADKGLAQLCELEAGLPAVTGDRDRLIQVAINLISNAVKFTDAGSVTCRARRIGDSVVVSVVDTGMGISEVDQAKVFERFKQVGDTLTDKPKGTGLGLPICREIVEHHGGRIWLESAPGRGSTFSFSLPIVADDGHREVA